MEDEDEERIKHEIEYSTCCQTDHRIEGIALESKLVVKDER